MYRARSAERWAAVRALREFETPVTFELLAEAAGGLTAKECAAALAAAKKGESHARLLPGQLGAMQQLLDGEPPTLNRVAAAADIDISIVTNRGLKEGWKKPFIEHWRRRMRAEMALDAGAAEAVRIALSARAKAGKTRKRAGAKAARRPEAGRAARVAAMLMDHADLLIAQVEEQGGVLTKPQLDAMLAMVRLAEKFEPLAQKEAAAQQNLAADEIADLYDRLERRIETRAREIAAAERGDCAG